MQDGQRPRRVKVGHGTIKRYDSENPKAPIMKGAVTVFGKEAWVALFKSNKTAGAYDLAFEEKEPDQRREAYRPVMPAAPYEDDFDR